MGKKSTKTTSKTVYGNTTTTNPYVTSKTTNTGTVSNFNPNTTFDTISQIYYIRINEYYMILLKNIALFSSRNNKIYKEAQNIYTD